MRAVQKLSFCLGTPLKYEPGRRRTACQAKQHSTYACAVNVRFLPDDVTVTAKAGEPLADVASRAKVDLLITCSIGDCGSCEIEEVDEESGEKRVILSCLTAVPSKPSVTYQTYPDLML